MSIIKTDLFYVANATPKDYIEMNVFFKSPLLKFFGRFRKGKLLRVLFFASYITHRLLIRECATFEEISGYAEISNYPAMPALLPSLWPEFVNLHYCCPFRMSPTNTIFLNNFFYVNENTKDMLQQLFSEIFLRDSKLKFIVTFETPDYVAYEYIKRQNYSSLHQFSIIFYPKCYSAVTCPNTQKMHVIRREHILSEMRYRRALPEDNDDIVEIVGQDHPNMKKELGDFYIAEELLSSTTRSLLIVSEINHLTAGFIWLNEHIDLLFLLENYTLESFGNLLKFNTKERFKEKIIEITNVKKRPLDKLFTREQINEIFNRFGNIGFISAASNISLLSSSLCSHNVESVSGFIMPINERNFIDSFVNRKIMEFDKELKSFDYYVKIRRKKFGFYYNIPDGANDAPYDDKMNAFAIQLFGLKSDNDSRRVFRFMTTAFAAYPNKDYCLMCLKSSDQLSLPIMEILKFFIRIIPRPGCALEENLYIAHRSAVFGEISLYELRQEDMPEVKQLIIDEVTKNVPMPTKLIRNRISSIADRLTLLTHQALYSEVHGDQDTTRESDCDHKQQILNLLLELLDDPETEYQCFTIRCGDSTRTIDENTIVGFVLVRPFHNNRALKRHYHITKEEELMQFNIAEVVALRLHPFYHFQADLIFRELTRITNFYHYYYFMPTNQELLPNDLITTMQPVEPRRTKKCWFSKGKTIPPQTFEATYTYKTFSKNLLVMDSIVKKYSKAIDLQNDPIAVFQANLRPTNYFGNSTNIVILGLNDVCKAFLRLMIFSWHNLSSDLQCTMNCLPLLNITVICNPGVLEAYSEHSFKCHFCPEDKQSECWVNFENDDDFLRDVWKRMDVRTWINFVSGEVYSIDTRNHIVTMKTECEIVYDVLLLMCSTDFGVPNNLFKNIQTPANYSHINNRFDKLLFFHKLDVILSDYPNSMPKSIVIYGTHIRAYEFINFLLKHGVKSSDIHLFIPYKLKSTIKLNNSTKDARVEEICREMVEDLGVHVHDEMHWHSYTLLENNGNLKDVTFVKHVTDEKLTMNVDLFISYYEVYLETNMVNIFEVAFIATEQNLVNVNENYRTTQHDIYAIGNHIKHRQEPNHQYRYVSAQESAEKIINVLNLIENTTTFPKPDEKFSKPHYFQAHLPMDHFFVKVTSPKRYLAHHLGNEYEYPLVTYDDGDFCRVRLNQHGIVEEIVVVTQKKMSYDYLKFFCGRHELMLNNLKSRWYLRDIVNFLDFFKEPWVELLLHDKFEELSTLNKVMVTKSAEDVLKENISRDMRLKELMRKCDERGVTKMVEYSVVDFMRSHRDDFVTQFALHEDFPSNYNRNNNN